MGGETRTNMLASSFSKSPDDSDCVRSMHDMKGTNASCSSLHSSLTLLLGSLFLHNKQMQGDSTLSSKLQRISRVDLSLLQCFPSNYHILSAPNSECRAFLPMIFFLR